MGLAANVFYDYQLDIMPITLGSKLVARRQQLQFKIFALRLQVDVPTKQTGCKSESATALDIASTLA